MGRIVTLTVKLKFTEKIGTDEDYQEIVDNVASAIDVQIAMLGIAPDKSEAITKYVEVTEKCSGVSTKRTYIEEETKD